MKRIVACRILTCKLENAIFVVLFLLEISVKCLSSSDSVSVVTLHEERSRFWPVPDPNLFSIASPDSRDLGTDKSSSRSPSFSFKTKDGRSVAVFDDVLDYRILVAWQEYIHLAGVWRFYNYDGKTQNKEQESLSSGIPWTADFDAEMLSSSESGRRILNLVKSLPRHHGKGIGDQNDWKPYKVGCNILRRGDSIYVHRHAARNETEVTALLYLNQLWRKDDYGELLFYDEGDVFATIRPKFNRVVLWDSSIDYLTRPPSMAFKQSQLFIMVHYTQNHTKVEHFKQVGVQDMVQQKKAVEELFPSMSEPLSSEMNIGEYVTKKFVSKNGKKIFVFDNLFNSEDLDKLRLFTVKHGNYFFDDSIDIDSDNVQWIAAFNIDTFIQSRLWNITRQVAKYVSGTNEWFPYDIACNLIRSFDHTRIHEDCEKQEDEWTFLLYLTPNWTENFYGETVFREGDKDDSEFVASVLPRYGRVAIFQGIIPHSARPPSTVFTGARLSFAVKLSVNPWVARAKMMKQEFAHEENMHQSVLSLLKYYNDAAFEAHYKEELISTVEDVMEVEQQQRLNYLKGLRKMHFLGKDDDNDDDDDDERDDDDNDGDDDDNDDGEDDDDKEEHHRYSKEANDGEFDFEEGFHRDDENEFPEISQRKEYIYSLFKTLNRDADALKAHYLQFVKDNEVMTERYVREIKKLL